MPEKRLHRRWALCSALGGLALAAGSVLHQAAATDWCSGGVCQEWVARYDGSLSLDDMATAMAVDASGNVYVTGRSKADNYIGDYATIKYGPDGSEQWVVRYDGPAGGYDEPQALAVDGSGNVYVTGLSYGSGTVSDYATIKYGPDGSEQWVVRYDGPVSSYDEAQALAVDGSGNVYVTGESGGSGTDYDYATIKYAPDGGELWVARHDGPASSLDQPRAMAVDGSGNVYVTGRSRGAGTEFDYATIKYGPDGGELWVARYHSAVGSYDEPQALAVDGSGNVYVTGESGGSGTDYDYATIKYAPDGSEQWVARYDGPESEDDKATGVAVDGSGNVYVTGYSHGLGTSWDYATVKYRPDGSEQWVARYDGPASRTDQARALAVDGSGNAYVTGTSWVSSTQSDYSTIKYGPDGSEQWVAHYDGPVSSDERARALAIDGSGNVYVTGGSYGYGTAWDYATIKYTTQAGAPPVGGTGWFPPISEPSAAESGVQGDGSGPPGWTYAALAIGAALALGGGAWYARRRWVR